MTPEIDCRKACDRMVAFVVMLCLGQTDRVHVERAVERYCEGADACIRDEARDKRKVRQRLERSISAHTKPR
jgi:hypothetical protein